MITEEHGKFVLRSRDGAKILGRHPTRAAAEEQERAIEAQKHDAIDPSDVIRFDDVQANRVTGQYPTGLAIVLPLPLENAAGIRVAGILPPPDMHCTLVHLGRADAYSEDQRRAIGMVVRQWATDHAPIGGLISGVGRFVGRASGIELDPVYLTPSCPDLASAREDLVEALEAIGIESESMHGFVPHMCFAYVQPDAPTPWPGVEKPALTFDRVEIWAGLSRESFPLGAVGEEYST